MKDSLLFMTRRPKGSASGGTTRDPGEDAYGFLRQTCAAVIATGRLRPELNDPDELAQMCWGSLHGLVALQVAKGDDPSIPWRGAGEATPQKPARMLPRAPRRAHRRCFFFSHFI